MGTRSRLVLVIRGRHWYVHATAPGEKFGQRYPGLYASIPIQTTLRKQTRLIRQFLSYNGDTNINTTAFRLIAIQKLLKNVWLKADAKLPFDWTNEAEHLKTELELGKMLAPEFGIFVTGLAGIGHDRPFHWGIGFGLRFMY